MTKQLYLASGSPRRRELLDQIGVQYNVMPVDVDETPFEDESSNDMALRLALAKARCAYEHCKSVPPTPDFDVNQCVFLGADTFGTLDGGWLLKPVDKDDAISMLLAMSGKTHQIISSVALVSTNGERALISISDVTFKTITSEEAEKYWQTGEPQDKAGGYAIQGLGGVFIESIQGSYSGIVGLPLKETSELLTDAGIEIWNS